MKRVKLVVAYDGTRYCGWQIQKNGITIEEVLNKKLSALLNEDIAVIGASRTDSGVHAYGNVAVFDTNTKIPSEKICYALNKKLPDDIRIQSSCTVASDFHPRYCDTVKTYEYRILNKRFELPSERLYSHFEYRPLDIEAMREGAKYIIGEHDFISFCSPGGQTATTVRTIYNLDFHRENDIITMRITGNGFLYNMVRIIAGTFIKVGLKEWSPEYIAEIIESKDRTKAGKRAEAKGLFLVDIKYNENEYEDVVLYEDSHESYKVIQSEIIPKKKAYIEIYRANEPEKLMDTLTEDAMQKNSEEVYVSIDSLDAIDGCIKSVKRSYVYSHDVVKYRLGKMTEYEDIKDIVLEPVNEENKIQYIDIYNKSFYFTQNARTCTDRYIDEVMSDNRRYAGFAVSRGRRVGVYDICVDNDHATVLAMGFLNNYRGQHMGSALLAEIVDNLQKKSVYNIGLMCTTDNTKACKFFENLGFIRAERVSTWYVHKQNNL